MGPIHHTLKYKKLPPSADFQTYQQIKCKIAEIIHKIIPQTLVLLPGFFSLTYCEGWHEIHAM